MWPSASCRTLIGTPMDMAAALWLYTGSVGKVVAVGSWQSAEVRRGFTGTAGRAGVSGQRQPSLKSSGCVGKQATGNWTAKETCYCSLKLSRRKRTPWLMWDSVEALAVNKKRTES